MTIIVVYALHNKLTIILSLCSFCYTFNLIYLLKAMLNVKRTFRNYKD